MGYLWDLLENIKDKETSKESSNIVNDSKIEIVFPSTISKDSGIAVIEHEIPLSEINIDDVEKKELVEELAKLTLERNNLKHEVEYLNNYIKYLEDNFHFILKDCKLAKQLFGFKPL